jgi:Flp pilus assembly protein TadB
MTDSPDHAAQVRRNEVGVDAAATQERIDRLTARIDKLYTVRPGPSDREVNAATIIVFCYAAAAVTAVLAVLAHYRSVAAVVGVALIVALWPFVWAIWTRHKASADRRTTECLQQRRDLRLSRGCGTPGCEDCYDVDGSNRLG